MDLIPRIQHKVSVNFKRENTVAVNETGLLTLRKSYIIHVLLAIALPDIVVS